MKEKLREDELPKKVIKIINGALNALDDISLMDNEYSASPLGIKEGVIKYINWVIDDNWSSGYPKVSTKYLSESLKEIIGVLREDERELDVAKELEYLTMSLDTIVGQRYRG